MSADSRWPKKVPTLDQAYTHAREDWMKYWHEILPNNFSIVDEFNHGFPAKLPIQKGQKTLEVGAGLGEHLKYEKLNDQEYTCLEYRPEFVKLLTERFPNIKTIQGDIQKKQDYTDSSFDRIIAIHVLEHLPDLPLALEEIRRLLKNGGMLDVVLPTEGRLFYEIARSLTSRRLFEKRYKGLKYKTIMSTEHVNTYDEVLSLLRKYGFTHTVRRSFFPAYLPIASLNVCVGFRFEMKKDDVTR